MFSPATGCTPTQGDPCVALARATAVAMSADGVWMVVGTMAGVLIPLFGPGVFTVLAPPQAARTAASTIKLSTCACFDASFKRVMRPLSLSQSDTSDTCLN